MMTLGFKGLIGRLHTDTNDFMQATMRAQRENYRPDTASVSLNAANSQRNSSAILQTRSALQLLSTLKISNFCYEQQLQVMQISYIVTDVLTQFRIAIRVMSFRSRSLSSNAIIHELRITLTTDKPRYNPFQNVNVSHTFDARSKHNRQKLDRKSSL